MTERERAQAAYAQARHSEDLRALCAGDLFFLLVHGMGRADMDNDFCFARCREVQAVPDGCLVSGRASTTSPPSSPWA